VESKSREEGLGSSNLEVIDFGEETTEVISK